jgi:HEPN domain-containing protein
MVRTDLQRLSRLRAQEARTLFAAGHYDGAYYLAGFAIECALKACIARKTQHYEFPDRDRVLRAWSHNLGQLLHEADLRVAKGDAIEALWQIVKDWGVDARYTVGKSAAETEGFLTAAIGRKGVVAWLK